MKKAIFIVLQTVLLLLAYAAGVFLQITGKLPMWNTVYRGGRSIFFWDGLVVLAVVWVLILLVQAIRKVIRLNWLNPVIALVLALLLLAAMHFPMSSLTPSTM